jgi:hypothetical protein
MSCSRIRKSVKVEVSDEETPTKKKYAAFLCFFLYLLLSDPHDIRAVKSVKVEDSDEEVQ